MKAKPAEATRARDLMVRDVITVNPDTPILDVHRLFVEEEIHGAPVVDESGVVCGVISTLDLLRVVRDELDPGAAGTATSYFRDELPTSAPGWRTMTADLQDRIQNVTAADAMTRDLVTVTPDTTLYEIAQKMRTHRVHRVLVCEERMLEGVVTTFDLLQTIAPTPSEPQLARQTGYRR